MTYRKSNSVQSVMKHFQVLGFSHDDQDVSRLEDVVTADMVVMFPIADDSEDLE